MEKEQLFDMALVMEYADGSPSKYLQSDGSYGPYRTSLYADKAFVAERAAWIADRNRKSEEKELAYQQARRKVQTGMATYYEYEQTDGSWSREYSGSVREQFGKELGFEEPI